MNVESDLLIESMARLFADLAPSTAPGWEEALASRSMQLRAREQVSTSGLPDLLVGQEANGFGGGWSDAGAIFGLAGSEALPYPVVESVLANGLLHEAGLLAVAGTTIGRADSSQVSLTDSTFTGTVKAVPWASHCEAVVLQVGSKIVLLRIANRAGVVSRRNLAGESRDDLIFEAVQPIAVGYLPEGALSLELRGAIARTAQIAGALESVLSMTCDYVRTRQQFGRPLSGFQAIQQQIAVLAAETAAVGCAAVAVGKSAAERRSQSTVAFEIIAAKLRANEAAGIAASTAHQIHGAMGITSEYKLHLFTRRLWSWRGEFGNDAYLKRELTGLIRGLGADRFWQFLTTMDPVDFGQVAPN